MVDLSEIAKDTGLPGRPFITPAVWDLFHGKEGEFHGRDLQRKILFMLRSLHAALTQRKGPKKDFIYFSTYLETNSKKINKLMLKATVKNPSSGRPIIMVMLPAEGAVRKTSKGKGLKVRQGGTES